MHRIFVSLLLLCIGAAPLAHAATWTDALGRKVDVQATPKRIVSLVPSVTEVLFALGIGSRVVGVTRYSDYPPAARCKPHVGSYDAPSIEAIVATRPDLVIADADVDSSVLIDRLSAFHIPVYVVYPHTLADTVAMLARFGKVAGVPAAGARLSDSLRRTIERAKAAVAGRPTVRVLLCEMLHPLVAAGPQTLADDLLRIVGGENVVPAGPLRYPTWGAEGVLAADPQVIVVAPHPGGPDPTAYFRRWPQLTAVRTGHVVTIDADWLQFPGPRLACGLAALVKALHGIDLDVKEPACSP
jgi:ABC-type Fe3+-hydroxamate transport system substrate-binding protein